MTIAEKILQLKRDFDEVYEAGKAEGGDTTAAYEQGVADGKQAEYDAFWDAYQNNGNRTDYSAAFSGIGWNSKTLIPKYDVVPKVAAQIFARDSFGGDLAEHFERIGVRLDFSQATTIVEPFYMTGVTRVGVLDTRSTSSLNSLFSYSGNKLKTVDCLILKDDGSQTFGNNSFINCTGLTNITVQGKIGRTVNMQWAPLSKASLTSVINALSTTTSGLSITLSKTAVNNAFATSEGAADGSTSSEWLNLIATRSNWTISLV